MTRSIGVLAVVLAAVVCLGWTASTASAAEGLDKAFGALATYKWGDDRAVLKPIDDAVAASHKNAAAKKDLEMALVNALKADAPQAAKDFICRKLSLIGSGACVSTVATLLTDEKLSHMARYALERIPDAAAVKAMRDALAKVKGRQKIGVVNSLGVRRDAESTAALVALLGDKDQGIAGAAAAALGSIGTIEAAKAIKAFEEKAPKALQLAAADAQLTCAERLLADGKKLPATAIYKSLMKSKFKHVGLAARRGLLAAMGKKK